MKKHGNFSKAVEDLVSGADRENDYETEPTSQFQSPAAQAVITRDMTIKGSVTSASGMVISGSIQGDVSCEADIVLEGSIEGNISGRSILVQGGSVVGNITTSGVSVIAEGSTLKGDVKAERIEVNGVVTGNLESSGRIILQAKASIQGDIAGASLQVAEGASIKGGMDVRREEPGT